MRSLDKLLRVICVGSLVVAVSSGCSKKEPEQPVDTAPPISSTPNTGLYGRPPSLSSTQPLDLGENRGPVDPPGLARVYFEYDSTTLSMDARTTLQADFQTLSASPSLRVEIEGHTDERGTNEYNMALGQKRANAVKSYLVQLGVSASRIETISYGEELPAETGHDEAAFAKNRRAQFRVLGQ
jgi:peptidoglycan-associated lipoprotein